MKDLSDTPILFRWLERHCPDCGSVLEHAMIPWKRFRDRTIAGYTVGDDYMLIAFNVKDQRSDKEHARYFAELHNLYQNLPETDPWYQEPEDTVRKLALIETGWCHTQEITFLSRKQASEMRPVLHAMFAKFEAVKIEVRDTTLLVKTPRSQAYLPKGMSKQDFRQSSEAVLELLRVRVGVSMDESRSAAASAPF